MSAGEHDAVEHVASVVYRELHRLASYAIRREHRHHSLQPTLLVNEAFLKLIDGRQIDWRDRSHFFTLASRMMRRIVVDYFRQQGAAKRPPRQNQVLMDDVVVFNEERRDEALMIDEALQKLSAIDPRAAQVVEFRYFGGLTEVETAGVLNVSPVTVRRDWEMAEWWLKNHFGAQAN
jgi:RNA polymerase sigma factor (TIGR02999 family)